MEAVTYILNGHGVTLYEQPRAVLHQQNLTLKWPYNPFAANTLCYLGTMQNICKHKKAVATTEHGQEYPNLRVSFDARFVGLYRCQADNEPSIVNYMTIRRGDMPAYANRSSYDLSSLVDYAHRLHLQSADAAAPMVLWIVACSLREISPAAGAQFVMAGEPGMELTLGADWADLKGATTIVNKEIDRGFRAVRSMTGNPTAQEALKAKWRKEVQARIDEAGAADRRRADAYGQRQARAREWAEHAAATAGQAEGVIPPDTPENALPQPRVAVKRRGWLWGGRRASRSSLPTRRAGRSSSSRRRRYTHRRRA